MRALVVLVVVLAACSNEETTEECAQVHVDCPNEQTSLQNECRIVAPRCPAAARALFLCMAAHQVCDGRGKLDRTASLAFCKEQSAEYERCVAPPDGGAVDTSTIDTSVDDTGTEDTGVEDSGADTVIDAKAG